MKQSSPFFDRIRVKPEEDRRARPGTRVCDNPGCRMEGSHRAPKGRHLEGEFHWFCLEHVRDYNATYNYFAGMNDAAVAAFQKDALTGHRPTWTVGVNGTRPGAAGEPTSAFDPLHVFQGAAFRARAPEPERRSVRNAERKALGVLGLDETADPQEIKARFKDLAKRHHPDSNGGDRSREDKLREVIQAYNYLKSVGFC